jgi:hypothetical protein
MRQAGIGLLLCVFAACGFQASPTGPDSLGDVAATAPGARLGSLAVLTGTTWSGEETAQVGESGALTAVITGEPPALKATLTWHSNRLNVDYQGEVTGTLPGALRIRATSNPGGGTLCEYNATARMPDDNTITGEYGGTGPGPCPQKRGTFTLRKRSGPPVLAECVPGVTVTGTILRGVANFTVHVGPVELSIVAFRFNGSTFLPQFWDAQETKVWPVGTHAWSIPARYQEDLFCGAYPRGVDLTTANIDYWHARKIAGDFRLLPGVIAR